MANINLIEHKKRLGEEATPLDYERQIERLKWNNKILLEHNSKLTLQIQEMNKTNGIINWLKNLIK